MTGRRLVGSCFQGEFRRLLTTAHAHLRAPSCRCGRSEQAENLDGRCLGALHTHAPPQLPGRSPPWAWDVGTPGPAACAPVTTRPPWVFAYLLLSLQGSHAPSDTPGCCHAVQRWAQEGRLERRLFPEAPGPSAHTRLSQIAQGRGARGQRSEASALCVARGCCTEDHRLLLTLLEVTGRQRGHIRVSAWWLRPGSHRGGPASRPLPASQGLLHCLACGAFLSVQAGGFSQGLCRCHLCLVPCCSALLIQAPYRLTSPESLLPSRENLPGSWH